MSTAIEKLSEVELRPPQKSVKVPRISCSNVTIFFLSLAVLLSRTCPIYIQLKTFSIVFLMKSDGLMMLLTSCPTMGPKSFCKFISISKCLRVLEFFTRLKIKSLGNIS